MPNPRKIVERRIAQAGKDRSAYSKADLTRLAKLEKIEIILRKSKGKRPKSAT